jgi:sec-independent protein translocase protein TatA
MPFLGHLPELIIVMLLALLIFGPKRLPEMGNAVGKTIKEFQKSMKEVTEGNATGNATPAATDHQIPPASSASQVTVEPPAEVK